MFIHAPTATRIASASPSQAQIVRSNAEGASTQRMNVKISISAASAAVIIAGVMPSSSSMLARRNPCQTINAIETGRYLPSLPLALRIGQLFGEPVEDIFELEDGD